MDTQTFQKQYPLALAALATHMTTHNLAAPLDIFVVDEHHAGRLEKVIRLHLAGEHTQPAWIASVVIDDEDNEPMAGGLGTRTRWDVRLPDSGFRFQLVGYRHHPLMSVVSA
jgi:hypothetical protein